MFCIRHQLLGFSLNGDIAQSQWRGKEFLFPHRYPPIHRKMEFHFLSFRHNHTLAPSLFIMAATAQKTEVSSLNGTQSLNVMKNLLKTTMRCVGEGTHTHTHNTPRSFSLPSSLKHTHSHFYCHLAVPSASTAASSQTSVSRTKSLLASK